MDEDKVVILIVENRRMICDILTDILAEQGFSCVSVPSLAEGRQVLASDEGVALVLVDVGLFGGRAATLTALAHVPELGQRKVVLFSCVESLSEPDVHLLRAPRDFSMLAEVVRVKLMPGQQALLGELLVAAGVLSPSALEAVLAVQAELRKLGQRPRLGELLVTLGFVSPGDVVQALQQQARGLASGEGS